MTAINGGKVHARISPSMHLIYSINFIIHFYHFVTLHYNVGILIGTIYKIDLIIYL